MEGRLRRIVGCPLVAGGYQCRLTRLFPDQILCHIRETTLAQNLFQRRRGHGLSLPQQGGIHAAGLQGHKGGICITPCPRATALHGLVAGDVLAAQAGFQGVVLQVLVPADQALGFRQSSAYLSIGQQRPTVIGGELVRPGDSIPAQSIKPFASSSSPIRNSCPSSWARSPAKEVIT